MVDMDKEHFDIIHLSEVSSTNDYAKDLLKQEKVSGTTLITADYQFAGKGHDKNSWESNPGENLLMSLVLFPDFLDISRQFYLSMAVSLGIIDFLIDLSPGFDFKLKWPNDIYFEEQKLGGVLINNEIMGERFKHVIAGIGLNINQQNFNTELPNPVSLKQISGKQYDTPSLAKPLAIKILERIELLRSVPEDIINDYLKSMFAFNQWRKFMYKDGKIRARISGVNEFGHLILQTKEGTIECEMKEISFVF